MQEFFCPLTTIFHTFLRNCRNNLSALFLCTKDSSFFAHDVFYALYYSIPHFFGKIQPFFQKRFRTSEAIKNLSIIQSRQNSKRYPPRKSLSLYAEKNGFCRGGFEEISKKTSLIYGNGRVQNSRVSSANNTRLYLCTKSASCFCAVWPLYEKPLHMFPQFKPKYGPLFLNL